MNKLLLFCCSLWSIFLAGGFTELSLGQTRANAGNSTEPQICVHLSAVRTKLSVGEPLALKVTITNTGTRPILIANSVSFGTSGLSRIEFTVVDSQGKVSPAMRLISDLFAPNPKVSPATALLGSWLLLRPGDSWLSNTGIDKSLFEFMAKPGKYTLSGTYSSAGLSYSPTYHQLGLSKEDVDSLPYQSWSGKLPTNEIKFEVLPVRRKLSRE